MRCARDTLTAVVWLAVVVRTFRHIRNGFNNGSTVTDKHTHTHTRVRDRCCTNRSDRFNGLYSNDIKGACNAVIVGPRHPMPQSKHSGVVDLLCSLFAQLLFDLFRRAYVGHTFFGAYV